MFLELGTSASVLANVMQVLPAIWEKRKHKNICTKRLQTTDFLTIIRTGIT